jgi:hypothetical protein
MSAFTRLYYANRGPDGTDDPFELAGPPVHNPPEPLPFPDDPYRMAGPYVESRRPRPEMRQQAAPRQLHDANRARVPM